MNKLSGSSVSLLKHADASCGGPCPPGEELGMYGNATDTRLVAPYHRDILWRAGRPHTAACLTSRQRVQASPSPRSALFGHGFPLRSFTSTGYTASTVPEVQRDFPRGKTKAK